MMESVSKYLVCCGCSVLSARYNFEACIAGREASDEDVDVGLHRVAFGLTVVHHFQHFFVDDAHAVNVVGIVAE